MASMAVLGSLIRRQADVNEMRLVLKPDERAPAKARDRVSRLRSSLEPRFDDVLLVVSELVTNSVRHSSSTRPIKMLVQISGSRIRLEVSDRGSGFEPLHSMGGGGLGLMIVDRIAASWGVHTNGSCTVWVEISKLPQMATGPDSSLDQSPARFRQPGG